MRPLDQVRSIKLKLSVVIVAAVAISAFVSAVGLRFGIPVWVRPFISAAIALLLVYPFARGITSPLREMASASKAMAHGDYRHPITTTSGDEVGELARAFEDMRSRLAEVDRQRRDLIANVSHELRTPLAALRARFENIADGVEAADASNIGATLTEIERLSRLVDQLLDLGRIESGAASLDVDDFAVRPLLDHAAESTRLRWPRVPVVVDCDDDLRYCGDEQRILQVVGNLLDNAARHSPPGADVEVVATATRAGVALSVRDHGPGIATTDRDRVFERFYRSDRARASDDGGSGLGLAIVRSIVELHDGTISITADEPRGCRMVVDLPHARSEGS